MTVRISIRYALAVALLFLAFSFPRVAAAETLVGSSVESRVILGFAADDQKVASLLPDGWSPVTLPRGPLTGVNLMMVFFDRQAVFDAEGKPAQPASDRAAAFVAYARKDGVEGVRTFVASVFEAPPVANSYGNSQSARIERSASRSASTPGQGRWSENWSVTLEDGSTAVLELEFSTGVAAWSKGNEALPYSSVRPEFHRIYRYDQLAELVMNTAIGREVNGEVRFEISGAGFGAPFDGNEKLVAVIHVPVYAREVFLP